jgi:hypothetical protein
MRVVVLADTHLTPRSPRGLPGACTALLAEADAVIHAGDIVTRHLLDELAGYGPVHAVLGNNDRELVGQLPEVLELDLGGVRVAVVHDSGPAKGRPARLRRRFPDAQVVVFGHSHIPVLAEGEGGQLLCNPGSPTQRRRQPHHTVAALDLDGGAIRSAELVVVGP